MAKSMTAVRSPKNHANESLCERARNQELSLSRFHVKRCYKMSR